MPHCPEITAVDTCKPAMLKLSVKV
jgi:hypothetical protein